MRRNAFVWAILWAGAFGHLSMVESVACASPILTSSFGTSRGPDAIASLSSASSAKYASLHLLSQSTLLQPSASLPPSVLNASPSRSEQQSILTEPVKFTHSMWFATGLAVGFNILSLFVYAAMPQSVTKWSGGMPRWDGLDQTVQNGPRWDNDNWYWNYVGHPIGGSEYFLLARNRETSFLGSFAYSAGMSAMFEFLIESAYERASYTDLIVTPVTGAALGELRYQAKMAIVDPNTKKAPTLLGKIAVVILDPIDALIGLL